MTLGKDIMRPIRKDMYGYYSRKFSKAFQPNKTITKDRQGERMKIAERADGTTRVAGYDKETQRRLRKEARQITDRLVTLFEEARSFRKV